MLTLIIQIDTVSYFYNLSVHSIDFNKLLLHSKRNEIIWNSLISVEN